MHMECIICHWGYYWIYCSTSLCKVPNNKCSWNSEVEKVVSGNVLVHISLPPNGSKVFQHSLFALSTRWAISINDTLYFHFNVTLHFYSTLNLFFFTFNFMSHGLNLLSALLLQVSLHFFPANRGLLIHPSIHPFKLFFLAVGDSYNSETNFTRISNSPLNILEL